MEKYDPVALFALMQDFKFLRYQLAKERILSYFLGLWLLGLELAPFFRMEKWSCLSQIAVNRYCRYYGYDVYLWIFQHLASFVED
jgi:hypothetical protein